MNPARLFVVLAMGLVAYAAWNAYASAQAAAEEAPAPEVGITLDPSTWSDGISNAMQDLSTEVTNMQSTSYQLQSLDANANAMALLEAIKRSEGTKEAGEYACLYGSTPGAPRTFASFDDHPRIAQRISASDPRWTTAAGAYQFMAISPIPGGGSTHVDTWDRLKAKLSLPDFSPASQDAAALELLRECGALGRLAVGDLSGAVSRAKGIWASLPGANYAGQGMRSMAQIAQWYGDAGGVVLA